MAKDPAFLFYSSDFLTGTMFMTHEQVGKYIRLLCAQHQKGHLNEKDMLNICGTYDEDVFSKFIKDGSGLYYNERCEEEILKRRNYCQSRSKNRQSANKEENTPKNISSTYVQHMENENEIENINNNNWRNSFEIYKSELMEVYLKLISDRSFIETQERFHPNVDIKLSLDKAVTNFWGTEAGWKHKKKQKSKDIDWKATLTKAIDMSKVYKPKQDQPKPHLNVIK